MDSTSANGGFPLPPATQPARLVASHHDACDGETRLRVPRHVPVRAVHRVRCARCHNTYAATHVVDEGLEGVSKLPSMPKLPAANWRLLSLPAAGVAMILALSAIQGGDEPTVPDAAKPSPVDAKPTKAERVSGPKRGASLVSEATFQLALPPGWERIASSGGAAFAAVTEEGVADATLWISRDSKLDFAAFEARALAQVQSLAGSAAVIERNLGPTPETTSITVAPTDAPKGAPRYEVLLRSSGRYWYYLATTVQPEASSATAGAVELLQNSLVPTGAKG